MGLKLDAAEKNCSIDDLGSGLERRWSSFKHVGSQATGIKGLQWVPKGTQGGL